MVTKTQAFATYNRAREFYRGGDKSTNKSYYGTGSTLTSAIIFSQRQPKIDIDTSAIPTTGLTAEQQARNKKTLANMETTRQAKRSYAGNSGKMPYEIGEDLYKHNTTLGNCGEMTAVAMYIAVKYCNVPADEVFMWTLTNTVEVRWFSSDRSFGHSFAVLGEKTAVLTERWAVDPWAGVFCSCLDYENTLNAKLINWTDKGKRITAPLPDGPSWVEPTDDIITGILLKTSGWKQIGVMDKGS